MNGHIINAAEHDRLRPSISDTLTDEKVTVRNLIFPVINILWVFKENEMEELNVYGQKL